MSRCNITGVAAYFYTKDVVNGAGDPAEGEVRLNIGLKAGRSASFSPFGDSKFGRHNIKIDFKPHV